jgi:putative tricarboxylic transport membrane protein
LSILLLAVVALLLPYAPATLARLRGQRPVSGRLVFGEGRED